MNSCSENRLAISMLLDGVLDDSQSEAIIEHLGQCPGCRAYYEDLLAIKQAFEDVAPPEGLHKNIMHAVEASRFKRRGRWGRTLTGVACAALAVALGAKMLWPEFSGYISGKRAGAAAPPEAAYNVMTDAPPPSMPFAVVAQDCVMLTEGAIVGARNAAYTDQNGKTIESHVESVSLESVGNSIKDSEETYAYCIIATGEAESLPEVIAQQCGQFDTGDILVVSLVNSAEAKETAQNCMLQSGFTVFEDAEGDYFTADADASEGLMVVELVEVP